MEKHLTHNIENKKLAGICAGFTDYFNLSQTLVCVIFLIGLFVPLEGYYYQIFTYFFGFFFQKPN